MFLPDCLVKHSVMGIEKGSKALILKFNTHTNTHTHTHTRTHARAHAWGKYQIRSVDDPEQVSIHGRKKREKALGSAALSPRSPSSMLTAVATRQLLQIRWTLAYQH